MGIKANKIYKRFTPDGQDVLKDITLEIEVGDYVSITGKSGSGKSTLLYALSTLDPVTQGSIELDGKDIEKFSVQELHHFRNLNIGFVFQFHYLLPELTVLENVLIPCRKTGIKNEHITRAHELIELVGLKGKEGRLPAHISGGEQQRVAIIRSLIMRPRYLFADEPTGNLDSLNAQNVFDLFSRLNLQEKMTIVYVTHDRDFASVAKRQIILVDGQLH